MPPRPPIVRTVKALRTRVATFRGASERVALVRSMYPADTWKADVRPSQ